MKTETPEPAPNPSDDRLMDALLREQARLGTRDDEAFLDELEKAMAEEKTRAALVASAAKREKLLPWAITAAAVAALAASFFMSPLFDTTEASVKRSAEFAVNSESSTFNLQNMARKDEIRESIKRNQESGGGGRPPKVAVVVDRPSTFIVPPVEIVVNSLHGKLGNRGAGHGVGDGDGYGSGQAPASDYGYAVGGSAVSNGPVIGVAPSRAPSASGGSKKMAPPVERPHSFELPASQNVDRSSERYGQLVDNPWRSPVDEALSTFSVDVDTASYSNFRRLVQHGLSLPADALRLEEMVNYFDYEYPEPAAGQPFSVGLDAAVTPWNPETRLVRVALHGREVARTERPPANLVFLIDVSGSMNSPDKLPLVIESFDILLEELNAKDTLSIVVYAGSEGLALPPTACDAAGLKSVSSSLKRLTAGGSTNGGAGITLAYKLARENFKEGGINRVILATDGDFNVGVTHDGGLVSLVEKEAKSKVFLTVLGFGTGNLNDSMLEAITNKGNGTYHYIDGLNEARRVFLQKMMGTLMTIAKDVKVQVEFNPAQVSEFRLLGYANRMLNKEDFNNDRVDAGDIGAGHTVTALYEIRLGPARAVVDALKYGPKTPAPVALSDSKEWMTVKLRYKEPEGDTSKLITQSFTPEKIPQLSAATADFRFATAVALTASLLRETAGLGAATLRDARTLATGAEGNDPHGLRSEFVALLDKLMETKGQR